VSLFCEAGSTDNTAHVSALTFQPTASGVSVTDSVGCTFDFAVCGDKATLAAPVNCSVATDSGVVTEVISTGQLTSTDGHSLLGSLAGTASEGPLTCKLDIYPKLSR
jgi:hypothetical protein